MVHLFALLTFFPAFAQIPCDGNDAGANARAVQRINQRHDDFFRYRDHLEEREQMRDRGRGENKTALEARTKRLEQARIEYLRHQRPKPDTTELEAKYEQDRKARNVRIEKARECYVDAQAKAEGMLKRGRMVPENKEFDLDE